MRDAVAATPWRAAGVGRPGTTKEGRKEHETSECIRRPPSCIELHVRETVRLDRLQPTAADGYVAAQYGALLAPGVTQLQLEAGLYHFRTLDDAQLRVIAGGVQVTSMSGGKDPWPRASATNTDGAAVWEAVEPRGHGPCGRVPVLRVVDDTEGASRQGGVA